jgi:tRNA A37 threonylcarbamoyltransferase TsaD
MSWFGLVKSAPKIADNIFDKDKGLLTQVGGWIGNSKFTEEEQAEMNRDIAKSVQSFAVATLEENTDRSKARRQIAQDVIRFYLWLIFLCGMTYPIDPKWSALWLSLASLPALGGLVVGVGAFFFGAHIHRSHIKSQIGNNKK